MRWEPSSQEELLQDIAIAQAKTNVDVGPKEGYCSRYYEDGWTVEYGCRVLDFWLLMGCENKTEGDSKRLENCGNGPKGKLFPIQA